MNSDNSSSKASSGRHVSRMPVWIRQPRGVGARYGGTRRAVQGNALHTVCEKARCPNRDECWSRGTATFLLLGDTCTRSCGFCSVRTGRPDPLDLDEPRRVTKAVAVLGLRYVVLTSVNRDDLVDRGAGVFARTLRMLREQDPELGIEFLTPDFQGYLDEAVATVGRVLDATLFARTTSRLVWGHNVETVPRLYRLACKGSKYERSLDLLRKVGHLPGVETKSAIMLGLGESREEVRAVLQDLRDAGVRRLAIGQYLRPTPNHLPVQAYVPPDEFDDYAAAARSLGFAWVKAGPLVRSSYHAEEIQYEFSPHVETCGDLP